MTSAFPLLPELWMSEIIDTHLADCRIRTRIMLRRTCRFVAARVPVAIASDPRENAFHVALCDEIRALVNAQCVHAVGWTLFGYGCPRRVPHDTFRLAYEALACEWLAADRVHVFWAMHTAYDLQLRVDNMSASSFSVDCHYAAIASGQLDNLRFLLKHEKSDSLDYYCAVLCVRIMEMENKPMFTWLLAHRNIWLDSSWAASIAYPHITTRARVRARSGDSYWLDTLIAYWKRLDNGRKTKANKNVLARIHFLETT